MTVNVISVNHKKIKYMQTCVALSLAIFSLWTHFLCNRCNNKFCLLLQVLSVCSSVLSVIILSYCFSTHSQLSATAPKPSQKAIVISFFFCVQIMSNISPHRRLPQESTITPVHFQLVRRIVQLILFTVSYDEH